jgi:hypothetical protein
VKDIRIGPAAQLVVGAGLLAGIGAVVAANAPELRRYMKVRSM